MVEDNYVGNNSFNIIIVKILVWLIILGRLHTKERMAKKKGVLIHGLYHSFWSNTTESQDHSFLH